MTGFDAVFAKDSEGGPLSANISSSAEEASETVNADKATEGCLCCKLVAGEGLAVGGVGGETSCFNVVLPFRLGLLVVFPSL